MTSEVKTVLAAESKPQLDEVRKFMNTLNQADQRSLLDFFQGARFMQSLMMVQPTGEAARGMNQTS